MITIIVPYYNASAWIRRCCESLHHELSESLEFIMVDDHSTDDSTKIVKEYADIDDRFFMYENIHTKGVSGARNTGLDHAEGRWVTFLDADDYMSTDYYDTFIMALKKANYSPIVQLDHLRYYTALDKLACKKRAVPGEYRLPNVPIVWVMAWNKLFERSFIEEHHIRFKEGMQFGEDTFFVMECLSHSKRMVCTSEAALIHCFDNKCSLSKSVDECRLMEQFRTYEDFMLKQTDPDVRDMIRQLLSDMWDSKLARNVFVEKMKDGA